MPRDFRIASNRRRIEDFFAELQLVDGLARSSVQAMHYDLLHLERFCERELTSLDEADLHAFVAHLSQRGVRAAALRRRISSLRRFYGWAARQGLCQDHALRLELPRGAAPFPKALSPRRTEQLLEARPEAASEREWLRNRAMLELAYGSGLRAGEICALRMQWLDLNADVVKVLGKGAKERVVPLSEPSADALRCYLAQARPGYLTGRAPTDAVFVTRLGRAMSTRGFLNVVKSAALAAGLPCALVSPHVLRHSFATDLVDGGADLRAVQMLLGHESIATTAMYLRTSRAKLREFIARHHPRG